MCDDPIKERKQMTKTAVVHRDQTTKELRDES